MDRMHREQRAEYEAALGVIEGLPEGQRQGCQHRVVQQVRQPRLQGPITG